MQVLVCGMNAINIEQTCNIHRCLVMCEGEVKAVREDEAHRDSAQGHVQMQELQKSRNNERNERIWDVFKA